MTETRVNVAVSEDYQKRFADMVRRLKKAGMEVDQQWENLGIIGGRIDEEQIERLKRFKGVAGVEVDQEYQLAPPESEVQAVEDEPGRHAGMW
jgi:hypothetical protein